MSDNNSETSTTTNDFAILMALVTEERIVFDFQVAEKTSKIFRVTGASTWKEAEEIIDEDGYHTCRVTEVDGLFNSLEDYKPWREERIKQVKIGFKWYDINRLAIDAEYYLSHDWNIRRVVQGLHQEVA